MGKKNRKRHSKESSTSSEADKVESPSAIPITVSNENLNDIPVNPNMARDNVDEEEIPNNPDESESEQDTEENNVPEGRLCEDYEIRVRPMIDLIDRLRRIGLDKDVGLPSIVVVGDQSAGKSSVLEAISGVQLPRGSGIVTRCPLELRLRRSKPDSQWEGSIFYKADGNGEESIGLDGPEDVEQRVRDAQDAIAGVGKGISTDLITLEVKAPNLPDLTLIDLPGIVRVVAKGQPENMARKIKDMIKFYIAKKETIILAVVPANVDIETSEALELAREVDPEHIRTLGVITKADLVDRGAEDDLLSVLLNERYFLRKGYIAVKCRGQKDITERQTLAQAMQAEEDFFEGAAHFRAIKPELYGIPSLSSRLTDELVEQVNRVLPDLKSEVFEKRNATRRLLMDLGTGIPADKVEKSRFLMKLLTSYADDLRRLAEGRENNLKASVPLHNKARDAYLVFAQEIQRNVKGKEVSGRFRSEVQEAMQLDRGRELPRFIKYDTFRNLAARIVSEFDDPSRNCLHAVSQVVNSRLNGLAKENFSRFPVLEAKVKAFIGNVMQQATDKAHESLTDMFEMEKLIFSQDQTYNTKLDDILKIKAENSPTTQNKSVFGLLDLGESKEKEVDTMFTILQAYMNIAVSRISDGVPMIIMQHVIIKVVETLSMQVMLLVEPDSGGLDALREEKSQRFKRETLDAQLRRLDEAAKELQEFNPV